MALESKTHERPDAPLARDRRLAAEAQVAELRLAVDIGELLEAETFDAGVVAAIGEFAAVLNRAPASTAMAYGLSTAARSALIALLDRERRALVESLAKRLGVHRE